MKTPPPPRRQKLRRARHVLPALAATLLLATSLRARADEKQATAPTAKLPDSDEVDRAIGRSEQRRLAEERHLIVVSLGLDFGGRRFSYSDGLSPNLPGYRVLGVPMLSFGLAVYPAAATGLPFLRDLGLRGWATRAFGLDSVTLGGTHIATEWTHFGGELHERILIVGAAPGSGSKPAAPRLWLGVSVGADAHFFDMSAAGNLAANLPAARTVSLRFGVDARLSLGHRIALFADGAYLLPLDGGAVYDRFRAPTINGLDVGGGLSVALAAGIEARLTGRYARYFSAFHPTPGDASVAGGALDETVQLGLGLSYAH